MAIIAIASIIVLGTNGKTLIRLLIRNQARVERKLLVHFFNGPKSRGLL